MKIRLREILKESWNQTKANYKFIIPLFLLVVLVSLILSLEGGDMFSLSGIFSIFLSPVFYYIITNTSLQISRGKKVGFKDILKGLDKKIYLSFLALNVLMSLVTVGIVALATLFVVISPVFGLVFYFALFIGILLYFVGVILFSQYRLIDVRGNLWTSIKESLKLGTGNRVFLLKFIIIAFLINFVGVLLLGVGILITLPLTSIAVAHIYEKIKINN